MSNTGQALYRISDFFENYARALENFDTKLMSHHYFMPCTLMSDESVTSFADATKLEGLFNQGVTFYKQYGIVKAIPEVWNKQAWTDKTAKVKVSWQYRNKQGDLLYTCDYHYVLRLSKNSQWKIMLSVSVNEKERMEAWLAAKK